MSWNALVINIAVKSHWCSTGINQFSWGPALRCHSPKRPRDGSRDAHLDQEYFDLCWRGPMVFYRELQWQAHSSFSPNNVTEPQFQRFLQPPSAIFQATYHSIFPKYCYLLEQRILPSAFCSLLGNGNFSPLREIQKDWTKQPCKVARSAGYCAQITTGQPGWEHVSLVTKGKQHSHLIQKLPCLLMTNCWLSLEWCFQLVYSGAIAVASNPTGFPQAYSTKVLSPEPTTYTLPHSLHEDAPFLLWNILFLFF